MAINKCDYIVLLSVIAWSSTIKLFRLLAELGYKEFLQFSEVGYDDSACGLLRIIMKRIYCETREFKTYLFIFNAITFR